MAETPDSNGSEITEVDFMNQYGSTILQFGDPGNELSMTLHQASQFEALSCPANPEKLNNLNLRLGWLAKMVDGANKLLPEHAHLLPKESSESE